LLSSIALTIRTVGVNAWGFAAVADSRITARTLRGNERRERMGFLLDCLFGFFGFFGKQHPNSRQLPIPINEHG
jgi:hypothetical protein